MENFDITYEWEFPHVVIKPKVGKFKNVIIEVWWRLHALDTELYDPEVSETRHKTTVFGRVSLPPPENKKTYETNPEDISHETIVEWVKPLMGFEGYEANLRQHLVASRAEAEREQHVVINFKKNS